MPTTSTLTESVRHLELHRLGGLRKIRAPRIPHWMDITQYMIPYAGVYLSRNTNREQDRFQDIIDETGTNANETLEAGMMTLRTSPSKKWFRFQTRDPVLNRKLKVKKWFYKVEEVIRLVFKDSNTNLALPHLYSESSAFGTAATIMLPDHDNVMHHHILTAGEFMIAVDGRQRVDTLYREFTMTVAQLEAEFGRENLTDQTRIQFDTKQGLDEPVEVIHAIEPRAIRDRTKLDTANMPWKDVYFEAHANPNQYLRVSGHPRFPCLVPRWRVRGGDFWGEGPGTKALGAIRQLQIEQLRKAEAIEYQTRPPLQVPSAMRDRDRDLLPGGQFPYDQTTPHGGVRTAFEVPLRIDWMQLDIEDVRRRIEASFYTPLFQPLSNISDTTQRTKAEVEQRRDEMLTVLSPVTQRMQGEIDEPVIAFALEQVIKRGLVPPAPIELFGAELDVEFIGPLAQALKAAESANIDRMWAHLGIVAPLKPEVLDRYNTDLDIEIYADQLGLDPELIIAGPTVALLREKRAEAEAVAAQAQLAAVQAGAMNDAAGADTSGQNALTDMLQTA